MDFIFKKMKYKFLNSRILIPKLLPTIIFIPFLYICGWIFATPILLIGFNKENLSLVGTIITFLLFIFSLPKWFEIRWGNSNIWQIIGINIIDRKIKLILYFFRGFLISSILIFVILISLILTKSGYWRGEVSPDILINAILLILGVGFAEELIFRGWLLEELKNQFGIKKAAFSQALIFSFTHIGFDLPFLQMLKILIGLFLLGVLLFFIRLKDEGALWGCIGLHGGLVGLWFIANNGLVVISKDSPKWLVGPGTITTNPLGGTIGILLMIFLCFLYLRSSKKGI